MVQIEFMRPRLVGRRFEDGAIPLEVLADLAVLQDMLIEVAKLKFKDDNPERSRAPRGFAGRVELRVEAVEAGSSAVLVIVLALMMPQLSLEPPSEQVYLERARDAVVGAVSAANGGRATDNEIRRHLPAPMLGYFDRLGRSLGDGEALLLDPANAKQPARLDRETRRKLVLASPGTQQLQEEVTVRGRIPEMDQQAASFHVELPDGRKIKGPIEDRHKEVLLEVFNGYRTRSWVALNGIGVLDRSGRLQRLQTVEHVTALDPLDVPARLDELRLLRDGWLDGYGHAPSSDGLDRLEASFAEYYPDDLPLPYLYPTPEGGVQAEWTFAPNDISLCIDLDSQRGDWSLLNTTSGEDDEATVELDSPVGWESLVDLLRKAADVADE